MEAADTHHGTAFQWKACLFIDLARIVSAFFSPLFSFDSNFSSFIFIFIILQLPLTQGSCLFTMYVRQSSGGEQRWYGWNVQDGMVPKKEHCFT